MFIKHFFLHYILENIYFLISLTGFFKTPIGKKFYPYIYEKYKLFTEKKTLLQLASFIKTGSLVLDIGANVGVYTKIFSNAVGPKGKVIAIEPEPINIKILTSIFQNSESNVLIVKAAASDKNEKLFLTQNNFNPAGSYISNNGLPIQGVTVDELALNIKIPVSLIKIDVEGLEFSVLKGMENILKNNKKIKILFEFMPKNTMEAGFIPIELLNYLTSYDFKLFCIDESTKKLLHVSNNEEVLKLCSSTNNTIGRNLFCEK